VLAEAGGIVQVEARHAAAINLLIGKSPTPNQGFDRPLTKTQVARRRRPADQEVALPRSGARAGLWWNRSRGCTSRTERDDLGTFPGSSSA